MVVGNKTGWFLLLSFGAENEFTSSCYQPFDSQSFYHCLDLSASASADLISKKGYGTESRIARL